MSKGDDSKCQNNQGLNVTDEEGSDDDSTGAALCEILGLASLQDVGDTAEVPTRTAFEGFSSSSTEKDAISYLERLIINEGIPELYQRDGVVVLPVSTVSVPPALIRRWTEELVRSNHANAPSNTGHANEDTVDRSYEYIASRTGPQKVLTRLENFVNPSHPTWHNLCHGFLKHVVSIATGTEQVLYKEKLNLKPPGANGFAPHLDTPSLRAAGDKDRCPQSFVTVMVAIDNMTTQNGCLRVCRGDWKTPLPTVSAGMDDNPDAGGRAGALEAAVANSLQFDDLVVKAGTVVCFGGYVPHRSSVNDSALGRRAVFFTYNPAVEGDFHDEYYARIRQKRDDWRRKMGLSTADDQRDLEAFATVPV